MPTTRNINETGSPNLAPTRLSRQLQANSTPPIVIASAVRAGTSMLISRDS
jgi:hypothetical protein